MLVGEFFAVSDLCRFIITAEQNRGRCPVFKAGDKIAVEKTEKATEKTDALCTHTFGSVLSITIPLSRSASFKELGLAKEEGEVGYKQYLNPEFPYISGGTVISKVEREEVV